MRKAQTEVLVIGGGATGTGVVRDLAMRGFDTILVEKRDLTHGTTGRYHGLLHSGGRYVVKDPQAARECIEENRILRRIMPHCIEDTGGFFVLTPWDDPEYAPRFVEGCRKAGIPVEEISAGQMLKEEPLLNPRITRCFRVPDAAADSFLAADLNAQSARLYGARVWTYHEVVRLLREGDRVVGAVCHNLVKDEEVTIHADMVVNAAGAWAGQIAAMVGVLVQIVPGKGVMLAVNHRVVNTVVNRCKMPADGDIIVPIHTVAVIGTTDVRVSDPEHFAIEPWEVQLMLDEGEKLVPGFKEMRILRAWAGVRPLYQETQAADTRDITRAYTLLDHETRDGVAGFITITGGKWTTYRLMAQVTADKVCEKLGVERECRTHLEPLPGGEKAHHHWLGAPLARVERARAYGDLVCECELATYEDVVRAITVGEARTIDDIRRDVRLGMGPCQGGFCTYRAAGILHALRRPPVEEADVALRDFLQERWKGLLPILWGQQLRQERLDELIYLSVLNADHLPGPKASRLAPVMYEEQGSAGAREQGSTGVQEQRSGGAREHRRGREGEQGRAEAGERRRRGTEEHFAPRAVHRTVEVLVIGAGLAGLVAAWRAAERGRRVRVVTKGWGATHWHAGCVDVLGYFPLDDPHALGSPVDGVARLIAANPQHPYARVGLDALAEALTALQDLCASAGYPLHGSLEHNWLLPSAVGAFRPTCLAPETMTAGDLRREDSMLIVGFEGLRDFYPGLVADNLTEQGILARDVVLDLPALRRHRFLTPVLLARLFDTPEFRAEVARALKPKLGRAARVGFPAVLGLDHPVEVKRDLEGRLGREVFEIPTLPPSVPGMRLHNVLLRAIERAGGRVFNGMEAVSADAVDGAITTVWTEAAARQRPHRAGTFVLATGGILGGGIVTDHRGHVRERVFNLPLIAPLDRSRWFRRDFLDPRGHPVYRAGLRVNRALQPTDTEGQVVYHNLFAVGTTFAHCDVLRERSFEGVALVTGYVVGERTGEGRG